MQSSILVTTTPLKVQSSGFLYSLLKVFVFRSSLAGLGDDASGFSLIHPGFMGGAGFLECLQGEDGFLHNNKPARAVG